MKTNTYFKNKIRKYLVLLMLFISYHNSFAQRGQFYTLQDGDFLESTLWGFNSTALTCDCYPDDDGQCIINVPANKLVNIYHHITTNCGIYIGANSDVVVHAGGSLTLLGSADMIGDGYLLIEPGGTVTVGGDVNLTGNSTVWDNGLFVVGGSLSIDGSGLLCGSGILVVDGIISGTPCNTLVLPIELANFTGNAVDNSVLLSWETASEHNNDFFELERSTDGVSFSLLSKIDSKAKEGNSLRNLKYSAIDEAPIKGISYYRIKQTDFDGKFRYAGIISVNFFKKETDVNFYPNPSNGDLFISFQNNDHKSAELIIKNSLNNIIYDELINTTSPQDNKVSILNEMPSGIYYCSVTLNNKTYTQKIIILPK